MAGATFTNFKAALTADGLDNTTATNDATEYCRRLAVKDALLAGRNAAQSASTWITMTRYGAGANPLFSGSGNTIAFGIDLSGSWISPGGGVGRLYGGGWKIASIDFVDYSTAAIRAEGPLTRGLWITGSTINHITGVPFNTATHVLTPDVPGYSHFTALGLDPMNTRDTFIDNCQITNTDTPFYVAGDRSVVDNTNATHSYYLHPYLANYSTMLVNNSVFDHMIDGPGLASGAAGFLIADGTDLIMNGVTVSNTRPGFEGDAVDFEGFGVNMLIQGSHFDHNSGAGFLIKSTGDNTYTMLADNVFDTNANIAGTDTGVNLFHGGNTTNRMIWVRNDITKKSGQNFLYALAHATSPTNTITVYAPNAIFGADNTVH